MRSMRVVAAPAVTVGVAMAILLAGCGGSGDDSAATDSPSTDTSEARPDRDPGVDKYPLGEGHYVLDSDPGWVFFRTPAGVSCGIGPVGRVVGCDVVPSSAPAGTNQTVIDGNRAAAYRKSDTPTFTRKTDVLAEGHRVTNGATRCAVGAEGAVTCEIVGGTHGFVVSPDRGVLW